MTTPSRFGELLREHRANRNMTQAELADAAGLPAAAISHFERGERHPSLGNFATLCEALWLPPFLIAELLEAVRGRK